jgi:hypothetical protein
MVNRGLAAEDGGNRSSILFLTRAGADDEGWSRTSVRRWRRILMSRVPSARRLAVLAVLGVVALLASATTAVAAPPARAVVVTPATQAFGVTAVGTSSEPVTFTVTHARPGRSVTPLRVSIGGSAPTDFTIRESDCRRQLRTGHSCSVEVAFTPTEPGTRTAYLRVSSPAGDTTATLTGQAFRLGGVDAYEFRVFNDSTEPVVVTHADQIFIGKPDDGTIIQPTKFVAFDLFEDDCPVSGDAQFTSGSRTLYLQLSVACPSIGSATSLPGSTLGFHADPPDGNILIVHITG